MTSPPQRRWTPTLWSRSTRTDRSPNSDPKESAKASALSRELRGIALLLFALFLTGALGAEGFARFAENGGAAVNFGWLGTMLAHPITAFFGWPAAALLPLAPAAHALRLFGRLEESKDRSWMVFLLGLVVILPVALGLTEGGVRQASAWAGLWGSFSAFYLLQLAGPAGAWVLIALAMCGLMAATLSWNPLRVVIGKRKLRTEGVSTG
ncbi:MAG: DNA translocase FtsK 4TM domain-containing protein, partial [Gemmatimonadaceae bacterium]|nr:DNA translocase FtsK 4TM domain-containing protein [Gemmatimonadaceae bacterium]